MFRTVCIASLCANISGLLAGSAGAYVAETSGIYKICMNSDEFRQGDSTISTCQKAKEDTSLTNKERAQLFKKIGDAHYWSAEFALATENYIQAFKLDPEDTEIKLRMGKVYRRNGMSDQAELLLTEVISEDPKNASAIFNLGLLYEAAGNSSKALSAYDQAVSNNPNMFLARAARAKIYIEELRDPNRAVQEYDAIIEAGEAKLNQTKFLDESGLKHRDYYLAISISHVSAMLYAGQVDRAQETVNHLSEKYPDEFRVQIKQGEVAYRRLALQQALDLLEPANQACRAHQPAVFCDEGLTLELDVLFMLKRDDRVINVADLIINGPSTNQEKAEALYTKGRAELHQARTKEAAEDIYLAAQYDPQIALLLVSRLHFYGHYKDDDAEIPERKMAAALNACMRDFKCASSWEPVTK